jgi:hypothetical protein
MDVKGVGSLACENESEQPVIPLFQKQGQSGWYFCGNP